MSVEPRQLNNRNERKSTWVNPNDRVSYFY